MLVIGTNENKNAKSGSELRNSFADIHNPECFNGAGNSAPIWDQLNEPIRGRGGNGRDKFLKVRRSHDGCIGWCMQR